MTCPAAATGLATEADPASWTIAGPRPYADVDLGAFGPDSLTHGSDRPVCTPAAGYAEVLAAGRELTSTTAVERGAVFEGTAHGAVRTVTGRARLSRVRSRTRSGACRPRRPAGRRCP